MNKIALTSICNFLILSQHFSQLLYLPVQIVHIEQGKMELLHIAHSLRNLHITLEV